MDLEYSSIDTADFDPVKEEYATAIGHVVISYNSLECVLLNLARMLWAEESYDQVFRLFGRRSMDERLGMLAKKLAGSGRSEDWNDRVDQLLKQARFLSERRNDAVHAKHSFNLTYLGNQTMELVPDAMGADELLDLSTSIDEISEQLALLIY